jgi:hypothetical protein
VERIDPEFLLTHPELVTPAAPWVVTLDNLELGVVLLAQPWLAGAGVRRAEIEHQLTHLAHELPVGPVYFQRVNRAVARLEQIGVLQGSGVGRARRFSATPAGLCALILNLQVLRADPTVDGSEFELKRALVAMCNLVADRLANLAGEVTLDQGLEEFFSRAEALEVWGQRVISDEATDSAFDVLRLLGLQRTRVEALLAASERRLESVRSGLAPLRRIELTAGGAVALGGRGALDFDQSATLATVRQLAASVLPELSLRATALRYRHYLDYLDGLRGFYTGELRVVRLGSLQLVGRR